MNGSKSARLIAVAAISLSCLMMEPAPSLAQGDAASVTGALITSRGIAVKVRMQSSYREVQPKIITVDFSVPKANRSLHLACLSAKDDVRFELRDQNNRAIPTLSDPQNYAWYAGAVVSNYPGTPTRCEDALASRDNFWAVDLQRLYGHLGHGRYTLRISTRSSNLPASESAPISFTVTP
jgi:hypothetical protein